MQAGEMEAVTVEIPLALRPYAGGAGQISACGETVASVIDHVLAMHPDLRRQLFDDAGQLRGYVNIFVNDDEVRSIADGMNTSVGCSDVIMIVPSIAGG